MTVPGIYSVSLNAFGVLSTSYEAKLNLVLNKVDGSGEKVIGAAHVQAVKFGAASFATMVLLTAGDELYTIGNSPGRAFAFDGYPFLAFEAHLLYKPNVID